MVVRSLAPVDREAARALVNGQFAGTRYLPRLLEQIDLSIESRDAEYGGMVAYHVGDERAALGVILFGEIAGANGAVKIHALVGEHADALRLLIAASEKVLASARLALCELPDDALFETSAAALRDSRFVEEVRAEELVADDVALRFLVRRKS